MDDFVNCEANEKNSPMSKTSHKCCFIYTLHYNNLINVII